MELQENSKLVEDHMRIDQPAGVSSRLAQEGVGHEITAKRAARRMATRNMEGY